MQSFNMMGSHIAHDRNIKEIVMFIYRPDFCTCIFGDCSAMGAIPKTSIAAPSSLQNLRGSKKVQIMLSGILRHHFVKVETCDQFKTVVSAEEMMEAYHMGRAVQAAPGMITTSGATSLGSVPLTSSLGRSRSSVTLQGSSYSSGFNR